MTARRTGEQAGLKLAVLPVADADVIPARDLAGSLELPVLPPASQWQDLADWTALLVLDETRLALQQTGRGAPGPVTVEFGAAAMRHRRRSGHNELLGRAVGVGKKTGLRVLDATAGLGRDGFILADLGCEVLLCERSPIVCALLSSGMAAAAASGDTWLAQVLARMRLHAGDARELPRPALEAIDVIYLDPMFPARGKSAAVKKEMALFQRLLEQGEPADTDALWRWAMDCDVARVVVKRPARAPSLAASPPSHSIGGKAVRYDVYVHRGLG